jgi:hypothetical protein
VDNIKINVKEIRREGMDWIYLRIETRVGCYEHGDKIRFL